MVNLLVKTMQQRASERIEGLETFMHVPFDLYTLTPLKDIINDLVDVRYNIPIAPTSTMKFVVNEELYQVLQAAVRKISMQAKRDPIIYDYMCWDNQH
jgi:Cdc6-like AAA superfamily ATPase